MMSTIDGMNYTAADVTREPVGLRRLAAARAVLLRATRPPAAGRRRARAVARAVPRPAPDRAGPIDPDGPACRDARLRRIERDGAGGQARIAGPRAPPAVLLRPSREGAGPDTEGHTTSRPPARSHDGPPCQSSAALNCGAARSRANSCASARVTTSSISV